MTSATSKLGDFFTDDAKQALRTRAATPHRQKREPKLVAKTDAPATAKAKSRPRLVPTENLEASFYGAVEFIRSPSRPTSEFERSWGYGAILRIVRTGKLSEEQRALAREVLREAKACGDTKYWCADTFDEKVRLAFARAKCKRQRSNRRKRTA